MIGPGEIHWMKRSLCEGGAQIAVLERAIEFWAHRLGKTSWSRYADLMIKRRSFLLGLPPSACLDAFAGLGFQVSFDFNAWTFEARGAHKRTRMACGLCAVGFQRSFFLTTVFSSTLPEEVRDADYMLRCPFCGATIARSAPCDASSFLTTVRIRHSKEWIDLADADKVLISYVLVILLSVSETTIGNDLREILWKFMRLQTRSEERWRIFEEKLCNVLIRIGDFRANTLRRMILARSEDTGPYLGEFRKVLMAEIEKSRV